MKVLHIIPGFRYGGVESRLLDWYESIDRSRIRFDVLKVTPDEPNVLVDRIREMGGEVFSVPDMKGKNAINHYCAVKKIIYDGNYDVIHAHSLEYGYLPLLFARKMGCSKRIIHARTVEYDKRYRRIREIIGWKALKEANILLAVSEKAGKSFFCNREFRIIKNGIFLDRFVYDESIREKYRQQIGAGESFVVGFVGRFSTPKNIPFLFEVFGRFHSENSNSRLLIIGNDKDDLGIRENAIQIAKRWGMTDDVIFMGRQENVNEWLNAMDVFLMPSIYEGFPTSALEAQANGVPCILSDKITPTIRLSDHLDFAPITDPDLWVKRLLKIKCEKRKAGNTDRIIDEGYDINKAVMDLELLYLR